MNIILKIIQKVINTTHPDKLIWLCVNAAKFPLIKEVSSIAEVTKTGGRRTKISVDKHHNVGY
jgi:hypothetical protein